ncbi:MAG: GldG family protein [Candidatus Paceibacterota bacterium]
MNKNFLKSTQSSIAIFFVFLLAINYLVSQTSWYFDLTQNKIYTASEASENILEELEDPVTVTFYISKDLPSNYVIFKTQIQDILSQYEDLSKGKLQVKYEEPDNEDETVQELATKGIPQLQSEMLEKDKIEVKNFFFGAEITSGEGEDIKIEVLPAAPSLESFEYTLISAVYSVSKEQKEVVAFLTGHGEKDMDSSDLAKSYDIQKVSISAEGDQKGFYVADDVEEDMATSDATQVSVAEKNFVTPETVIIAGPQSVMSAEEMSVLDDFVASGGKVVVLAEKINPDLEQGFVTKNIENNVSDFTKKYGIEINNDLVYDNSNLPISYTKQSYFGMMQMTSNYPYWVKAVKENFSDHPSLSKAQSIVFLWTSSLTIEEQEGYEIVPLITSSKNSEIISENITISPEANLSFTNGGKKTLAAISTAKDGEGQVVVIGDSDFASPTFMQSISDNEVFFLNLVDGISSSANLSSIRSKNISDKPIKELTESEKNYWKFFAIFGGAILLCAYGFVRISKRKKLSRG